MFSTFRMCRNIQILDLSNFDTSKVINVDYLFQYCQRLKTIYASNKWNNNEVKSSDYMFQGCQNLVGVVQFSSENSNDINFANYNNGYFTLKN